MAFFRQLKLLLWKNSLGVVRQPAWSLTLIIWPLIIFIIIAVTRNQFPPVLKETCYVAPRNLPSTGFFPFLQTLMCNTDTYCHNKSQINPTSSKHGSGHKRAARSPLPPKDNPLARLIQGEKLLNIDIPPGSMDDAAELIKFMNNIFDSSPQQKMNNASLVNVMNASLPHDQSMEELMASMTLLKKTICQSVLPMMNMSSPTHLTFAVVTFCKSNNTVFEVTLVTLNQLLVDLMLTRPEEMVNFIGATLFMFDHLQNQNSLWEAFLSLPELFSSISADQIAETAEALLTNIQGVLHIIQTNFPNVTASVQAVHPVLAGGISITRYIQNWPGKHVSVSLGDVLVLHNDSLSEMVKPVLQAVKIPLDKAFALTLDSDVVHGLVCNNSDNAWLTAACMTGTVDMFLGWISTENLAKQVFLKWSKHVAQHDLLFAKGVLEALMGVSSPRGRGGSTITRTQRSVETKPQNTDEDLFLSVGEVVLDILQLSPEASAVVQVILRTGLESMETATLTLQTVNKMVDNILKDANQLQMNYFTLMMDQDQTKIWMNRLIENVLDVLMKGLASETMTCEDVLGHFEWLLDTDSVRIEVWRSAICQNDSVLQEVLLSDWMPLIYKFQKLYYTLQGYGENGTTLSMILSEWHLLSNQSLQFGGLLEKVAQEIGPKYWLNWMLEHNTTDFMGTLQQSVLHFMVRVGQEIEKSQMWPKMKDYFHMIYWIMNYRSGTTTQPANCSVDLSSLEIHCDTGLNWSLFVQTLSQTLMSPSQGVLLNYLKGTVNLLQHVYGDVYKYLAASNLKKEIHGGDALSDFLINLMNKLNDFTQNLTTLPDHSISNPYVMFPLYNQLLQSTGLAPLLPLILSDSPLNITQVFEAASKLGRLNQHIFTFNETDPTMPELERLIMQFLSSEGNLTMSLAFSMGNTLLTYSQYISPEYVARLREAIQPYTNQTSAGIVEAILSAIELVKTVMDSPDGNPTTIILGYIRQLQECIVSLLRLRRTEQVMLPNGQLVTTQVTDLYQPTVEILNLLTPEALQTLGQAEPAVAQDLIAKKVIAFLPAALRQQATVFLRHFVALQHQVAQCVTGPNCLTGISEIFTFLDQILDMMVSAKGNVTIEIASSNSFLGRREYDEVAITMFSLLLSPNDVASVTTFKQALLFIRLVLANPNVTVSHVQNALKQSNLTIEELNQIASLAGAKSVNDLVVNILTLISSYQCFELHPASVGTTQCVVGLINGISSFLMHVPALQSSQPTAILSIIPVIINKTLSNIAHSDFSLNPDRVVFQTLNRTLANVQMALHMNNLSTPAIMNEFKVLENILKVAADPTPLKYIFNLTMDTNSFLAQKAVQEMIMWYLKRLENVTSSSSISDLLDPFFHLSQMQVALQVAQADVSIFVSDRVEHLMHSLQYPLDAEGLRKIGQTVVEILQRMFNLVMGNLDAQNSIAETLGSVLPFNTTALDATELQITHYLNFLQQWLTQPHAPNMSIKELNDIAVQAGAASVGGLVTKIMALVNYHQCFEHNRGPEGTSHCVTGLMNGIGTFLMDVPALKNERAILSLIPVVVNQTISNIMHVNFSSNPHMAVIETLNMTLGSIKMTLQMNNLSTPEIMNEIRVIENILKVGGDPTALSNFHNDSMDTDPLRAQKVILETLSIYLKRLESATSGSGVSAFLIPFFDFSQMQVALQLEQVNFSIFINDQMNYFMSSLQYPLNAEGLRKIGLTTVQIVQRLFKLVMMNLDAQNNFAIMQGSEPPFNATLLDATKVQVNLYLSIIQQWMTHPNALQHLNLTTEELHHIAAQAGFSSINDLLVNIMMLVNSHQCFEQEPSPAGTARCVMGLITKINGFLRHVPALKDEKSILSLIPFIFNKTISNIMHANFTSNAHMAVLEALNTTLVNIKMTLQLNNFSSPEIMNEVRMIENLLKAGTDPTTLGNFLNATIDPNPLYAQKVILETLSKSLKRLENATSGSSIAHVFHPILRAAQMQVELQLAQINFSIFISNQISDLTHNLQFPLNAEGLSKIGKTTIEILQRMFKFIKHNLDTQNNSVKIYGFEMPVNATLFAAAEFQINFYLNIIQHWMAQPNVFVVLTSMLQWGNSSMSYATPVNDFYHLLQTVHPLLDENQRVFLSLIGNITRSLSKALTVAQKPNGLQSDHFLAAILEAIQTIMVVLTPTSGPVPVSLQQNILEIVQYSVKLIVHPDLSYAGARNLSLLILENTEGLIQQIFPEMVAEYMLAGVQIVTTYFETISTGASPDNFNELILNEMKTIHSLLPPNNTARAYISALINITHFILASGQDNMGLWGSFENVSSQSIPLIIEQMGKLLNMIWRLIMGSSDSLTQPESLKAFSQLPQVLEQVIEERATQETWHNVKMMLQALLSIIEKTEHWESVPAVVSQLEKAIGALVKTTESETGLIVSLQMPVMTLMTEIVQSVNSSNFNLSEVSERMQHAIENTLMASQQANGTLPCSKVLKIWEGVREATGLSPSALAMWCNTSFQSAIEMHAEADKIFAHLNMNNTYMGPVTVNATAARIVKTVQSFYYVSVNQSRVLEQFVMNFSRQLEEIAGQPLSPEAQFNWYKQLQDLQLENSLMSIKMLSEELLKEFPFLKPYIAAVEAALTHILKNYDYDYLYDSTSSQNVFSEAAMMFLSSLNITSDDMFMMWGNGSDLNPVSIADMMIQTVQMMVDVNIFGEAPMVYQALEQLLTYNDTRKMMQKVAELFLWLTGVQPSRPDFLTEALPELAKCTLSFLKQIIEDLPINMGLFEDLPENIVEILRKLLSTPGVLPTVDNNMNAHYGNNTVKIRHKRELPAMPMRSPVDDFIDLIFIDYSTMFSSLSVPPTQFDIIDTAHVFFTNPDLAVVLKGATSGVQWDMNPSREKTIDAVLGMASTLTLPEVLKMSSIELVMNAVDMLPDDFPFSSLLKNITKVLASESQENLSLMEETINTAAALFQTGLTDPRFIKQLSHLRAQMCALENTNTVRLVLQNLGIKPGEICHVVLPGVQNLVESLVNHSTPLFDIIYQTFVGDPSSYRVQNSWGSVFTDGLGFNMSSLSTFSINITMPGAVTIGEMLRNKTAFIMAVQQYIGLDQAALYLLIDTPLPNNNLQILSWLVNLRHCNSTESVNMKASEEAIFRTLCSMSAQQFYSLTVLMIRHINLEKFIYRMLLPEEMQNLVGVMLQMAKVIINMMNKILPAIDQLQSYMHSIHDLNLGSDIEFSQMSRGQRKSMSHKATFVTISRALCSNGILALLGISKIPKVTESYPSFTGSKREEMIDRFKIPRNATPFCTNMYLDMVNTTGGAIAWAFLKPMLMGNILYTPDTPLTRAIMEKSNITLHEFGNLRKHSQDWIESSNYLVTSSELLRHTLPMLQNSLGNSFVKNFIEMQTDIDVGRMKETLGNFSNMTAMLEKNQDLLKQITTLSTLMVDLSSCIKFDRFRGYDSVEQLNTDAQELAKNRDLYASVIFKLPKDEESQKSSPSKSALPPKVSYTIRMHMDNVMRTDRVRDPYFVKDPHISATMTMRYNRGFVYLQETIDRAIIETQAGRRVTEPAVQLQPFPYPCHLRDEYLEAISFVFPLMLMIAWVLFVADFVKKLVHERELRLHEYMKMMGVNPLSHFFAWFMECASYLVVTIIILTFLLKCGHILPHSDGFLIFLYLCDYGLSILAFSYLISSFFDQTYIAGLSGSLLYILSFFPFIVVMAVETKLTFCQKSLLSLFSPTCFSYASQYIYRFEAQAEGIQWSNSYFSPIAGDSASFGWLCWLMLIDSILYFILGVYIRMVFPGKYGIAAPWYFPFQVSFWAELCCCRSQSKGGTGLFFTNIMQSKQTILSDDKGKGHSTLSSQAGEDCSELPVGVSLHGLSKIYGERVAIDNLNVTFYEGHVTSLLGHNGAGKTTTMSLLTGLFAPSSGSIEVYGKDMQTNINAVRKELGVCMQYDVLFDHMTAKEHLLLYGQIKAPHWSQRELREQVRTILEETGMYAHRHKRVGTLSGGMKRKLSISIAFIGGSRLVVLDEPTTGVDPCSRRNIWDIVIQYKKHRTIIMSTHHLDEAEVLSDRIAFLEKGGLKCCGSPLYLKDKLGQGYKLTITKKTQNLDGEQVDDVELKSFIQAHVPEARLKEAQGSDLIYLLPPFSSSNSSSYRSLLTALDANLDALQLGCYGISDTTLEEVFLHMTHGSTESAADDGPLTVSETVSDSGSIDSFPTDSTRSIGGDSDTFNLTGPSLVEGVALVWQQIMAILIKRFHHSRRDWKGLISQILLPVLFVVFAMGLGSIKNDLKHYPELELSPALYNIGPSYSFFSNQNPNSSHLVDTMLSFPGIDNNCFDKSNDQVCSRTVKDWESRGNGSKMSGTCKCLPDKQVCDAGNYQPPHKKIPSSQTVYNLSGINLENYLVVTGNDFIRNRYGGFAFGKPLPLDLQLDLRTVPKNRTLSKVWFNPEGHHTMPAYLNSLNNIILRANLPANKDPREYAISVSSHPYFGRRDDEDSIVQGMLQILIAMCVLTGYSITTASFAIYEVNEHHTGSKRLQHIAGITEPLYWAVNFFYDMALYMIPVTVTVGVIAAFQVSAFTDRQNLGAVALLLVLFGFATFPWMYLLCSVFKDAEMAFITYVCINLFISINTITSTSILYFLSQISIKKPEAILNIFNKLSYAFVIFPQFNFGNGLMMLARKDIEVQILSGYGIDSYKSPFCIDTLGWMFLASFVEGVLFFTLRLLINKFIVRKVRHLIFRRKAVPPAACEDDDEDVAEEHLRVASGAAGSDILQVNQLTKVYQQFNRKVQAVKRLSVGIPAGECFGLLGVNGAGKTTTFKMLTGDVSPTDGTAQIRDRDGRLVDIMECRNQGINIGYCPQVDALDDLLTGEEHLYFYARVHGISKREIRGVVNYLLKRLELTYHRNIITDGYSCGTRRKLSTALALVGHPQILLLDEPSSGMDPRTKRHLWKIISEEVKGKCAVVLTSHSMEECEALCSRLAIMVKGQFRCLGSLQHIKNRFGSGFTVKMYLAAASCDAEAITGFMQRRFPSTYLKDQHSAMVEYHVPVAPGGVADIFDQLESNKNALQIKHFSVSQTTLDEVFINFAMGKIGMEAISIDSEEEFEDLGSVKDVET